MLLDLEKGFMLERPRLRLARMIWSKSRTEGSEAGFDSRSWMNSLNAADSQYDDIICD